MKLQLNEHENTKILHWLHSRSKLSSCLIEVLLTLLDLPKFVPHFRAEGVVKLPPFPTSCTVIFMEFSLYAFYMLKF